jgi:hypothetical protein
MCTISYIGDHYRDKWVPQFPPNPQPLPFAPIPSNPLQQIPPLATKEDVDKLREEVENLKKLLKLAKKIDEQTGAKDCEMEEKIAILRKVADMVGIDLDDVFGPAKQ